MEIEKELRELRKLWSGFWASRVVLTANNLRVFDCLGTDRTAKEVAGLIKADIRATEILLNALAGLGLLRKKSKRFHNSAIAKRFLVKGSPLFQGDIIKHADTLWHNWSGLDEVIRTGTLVRKAHDHDSFIRGMHNVAVLRVGKVIRALDLKGIEKALDLGGGPGTYSIELARKGISVTLFDLPETIPISRDIVKETGTEGITFQAGDFLVDDIGNGYDLIFISQVLHSFSPEMNRRILAKCAKALKPGGKVTVHEFYIDSTLASPMDSALFSVNMLVNSDGGRCYAPREIMGWLSEAGFRKCGKKELEDTVLVSGVIAS